MTAPLFLVDPDRLGASTVVLDGPEGHHAADVRRLRAGELVSVGDGRGRIASCVVAAVSAGTVQLDVVSTREEPSPAPRIVVVQALAKGERAESAVELMTEVGVDEIVPWAAARSVVRWDGSRGDKALARWRATAREAGKQSRRAWLPDVAEPASTSAVCGRLRDAAFAAVLHEAATPPLAAADPPALGDLVLVVGPEGGITDEELNAFAGAGATAFRLGPSVLRTSTAGVAAAAVLLAKTGRWS